MIDNMIKEVRTRLQNITNDILKAELSLENQYSVKSEIEQELKDIIDGYMSEDFNLWERLIGRCYKSTRGYYYRIIGQVELDYTYYVIGESKRLYAISVRSGALLNDMISKVELSLADIEALTEIGVEEYNREYNSVVGIVSK